MKDLDKLYEKALLKWAFDWLPATPPGTYLHSLNEFKIGMETNEEFYNKVITELT